MILKTGQQSQETAWFLSNAPMEQGRQLFQAVRQHWTPETSNHIRDVTLKEDKLRTTKNPLSRVLAGFRTLVIKLLQQCKPKNMTAQINTFRTILAIYWHRSDKLTFYKKTLYANRYLGSIEKKQRASIFNI